MQALVIAIIISGLLFAAVPVLVYRFGVKMIPALVLIAGGAVFSSVQNPDLLILVVFPVVIGAFAGFTFRKGFSFQFYLISVSVVLTLVTLSQYIYMVVVKNFDRYEFAKEIYSQVVKNPIAEQSKGAIIQGADFYIKWIIAVIPYNIFVATVLAGALGYVIHRFFFVRFFIKHPVMIRGLEYFKMSDWTIFALIAGLAVMVFVDIDKMPTLFTIGLNLLLCVAFLYFIQALGILKFFFIKNNIPVLILPGALLLITALYPPMIFLTIMMFAGYGALDVWTDFRKLNKDSQIKGPGKHGEKNGKKDIE